MIFKIINQNKKLINNFRQKIMIINKSKKIIFLGKKFMNMK